MEKPLGVVIKSTAELRLHFIEEPAVDTEVPGTLAESLSRWTCPLWVGGRVRTLGGPESCSLPFPRPSG